MRLRELRGRMAKLQDKLTPAGERPTGVVRVDMATGQPYPEDVQRNPGGVMLVPVFGAGTVEDWEKADFKARCWLKAEEGQSTGLGTHAR